METFRVISGALIQPRLTGFELNVRFRFGARSSAKILPGEGIGS